MKKSLDGYYGLRRVLLKGVGIVGVVGGTDVVEGIAVVVDGAAAASDVVDEEHEGDVELLGCHLSAQLR